jgi:3-oxoacyl-[acyl-carrier-protein] synthase II
LFAGDGRSPVEVEMSQSPSQIVVIGTGHWRGEGMALVEAIK